MFGFGKKKQQAKQQQQPAKKKQSSLDKIILGAVVGGAIGSVLGVGLAPKKGSDTRKDIGKQAGKLFKSVSGAARDAGKKFQDQIQIEADKAKKVVKKIPHDS
jgi:gas vesicle protein